MLTKVYSGERPSILVSTNPKTDQIDPVAIFVELNKLFPSTIHFENIKLPEAKKYFKDKYKLLPENIIEKSYPIHTDGKIQNILFQVCYLINRDLIIFSRDGRDDIYTFIIFYCHTSNQEIIKELTDFFNSNYVDKRMSEIGIIGNNCNGLFIRFFNIKIPDIKISDYYNNDFEDVHNKIVEKLSNNFNKGVILFHGRPGNGKTTYLRYLSSIVEKRMIFIPPELAYQISSPNFLSLLMDYPNSILILEDAESVIKDRIGNDNSPVASILNISDGLLSDCLNLQIICTFNTDVGRIDKALLRKGRIITKYEFKELDFNKANKLAEKHGLKANFDKDASLAEIFNQDDDDYTKENKNSIGFLSNIPKSGYRVPATGSNGTIGTTPMDRNK